ncbi:DUF5313 family protein [Actinokineospora iranica]|uniref:DUF5313 domain-containing protein n=1 Tax=Actinokineospora iranica TaxID=1271860 RepID=A0A1G6MU52_9PSEU|nr:DUF5313 family protein [Actinokineospora iranica]SDC58737.1 hypothetical protein SAMN05216174_10314 [Actinokineospora iranica]
MAIRRPDPVHWVYFQYGGRLPDRYREWVLHNSTCRTWLARAFVRGMVQVLPILALLFVGLGVFGGSWPLAAGSVLLGFLVSLRFTLAYAVESVDARLVQHGYPPEYGSAVRKREDAAAAARYRDRWARER